MMHLESGDRKWRADAPDRPAALGGTPAFAQRIPLVRPPVPDVERVVTSLRETFSTGVLTNGPRVRELEERARDYLGVHHCIAVASCTSGLMLVLRASGIDGTVVLPSFTFAATAHAVAWNGLDLKFADVDRHTLTLAPEAASSVIDAATSAILATHTYGTPCDTDGLARVAREKNVRLFFDAAHAFGSRRGDVPIGRFGDAEVFSLSVTKVLVAAEGGMIATNDDDLAERCRIGRDYGNPGNYDCLFVGLNARMSEVHAAIALATFEGLEGRIERRNALARAYRDDLHDVPGISFPSMRPEDRSTYKDLTILVEPDEYGVDADALGRALEFEGIETRRYFAPPVHQMTAYTHLDPPQSPLVETENAANRVLTLPLWDGLSDDDVARVSNAIRRVRRFSSEVGAVLGTLLSS